MASRKNRTINLPAPYLRRVWLDLSLVPDSQAYPFCLPFLQKGFDHNFECAITIIVGENGTGKSTLLEGIAALAGYARLKPRKVTRRPIRSSWPAFPKASPACRASRR